jgi:hypothetical protein
MILGVDPGVDTGWCLVDAAGAVQACGLGCDFPAAKFAVLERPQIYRAGKSKGDPNDLITLAIQLGRYVDRLERAGVVCRLVTPTSWKGQVPKDIHHKRIEGSLSPRDARAVLDGLDGIPSGKQHNVLDAIGLARWAASASLFAT